MQSPDFIAGGLYELSWLTGDHVRYDDIHLGNEHPFVEKQSMSVDIARDANTFTVTATINKSAMEQGDWPRLKESIRSRFGRLFTNMLRWRNAMGVNMIVEKPAERRVGETDFVVFTASLPCAVIQDISLADYQAMGFIRFD